MSKVPLQGDAGCRRLVRPQVEAGIKVSTLDEATRLSTIFSSKVNLPDTIDLRAKCGANLVILSFKIGGHETLVIHRVVSPQAIPRKIWQVCWETPTPRVVQVPPPKRDFCIDNILVRINFIIAMIGWTGLAPWEFDSIFLVALLLPSCASSTSFCQFSPTPLHDSHKGRFLRYDLQRERFLGSFLWRKLAGHAFGGVEGPDQSGPFRANREQLTRF